AIARPVPLADAIRDLPTWASVSRQRQGGDIELGDADDTVSAALQKELQRELLAHGIDPDALDDNLEAAMQRLMAEEDDGVATPQSAATTPTAERPADADLYPRQAAG